MSRIVVYDLDGQAAGEIHAICNRGWAIGGGGQATIILPASDALQTWLQFGRMVMIEHPKLPAWGGVIDTAWKVIIPGTMTVYNCEYLLSLRTQDYPGSLTGSAGTIAMQLIGMANDQEDLLIREGNVHYDNDLRTEIFDQSSIWEHLKTLASNAGMEMMFYPALDANGRLIVQFDLQPYLGIYTGWLLHDGSGGNINVRDASVSGEIWNRIIGVGDQSTLPSRPQTEPQFDEISAERYRLRSKVVQFSGIPGQASQLETNVANYLKRSAYPRLTLTVEALDISDTFYHLRLGNSFIVQVSNVILPGGQRGWNGDCRITAMAYDEAQNKVLMTLDGEL
jgi:hypothetical protein